MAQPKKSGKQAREDASTHHSRYPARLHAHLGAAADAAEAIAAPLPVAGDAGTPDELAARYGGNGEPQGASDE